MHLPSDTDGAPAQHAPRRAWRALLAAGAALTIFAAATPAGAQDPGESTTTSTATSTSTSTVAADAVPEAPFETALRVTPAIQVTPTEPPPPTTTLPPDPCASLPANSGEGRRLIYSKSCQRVWAVEADGTLVKTHLVSGRMNQPNPGTYSVFSRSTYTCNIKDPSICWRYMVRFTVGPDGDNIGFHEIPKKNGRPVQTEAQLGRALSSGCVRQATPDAVWVWNWAPVGTKVVVLA